MKPYTFSYSELKNATNDFNFQNKLGEGGFGPVYKVNILPRITAVSSDATAPSIFRFSACNFMDNYN